MSFGLPSLKTKPSSEENLVLSEGAYGVSDVMVSGFQRAKSAIEPTHPLQKHLQRENKYLNEISMSILRNTQGLHAPLRLAMELKAVEKTGHLPFLPSHNVLRDSLTGRDLEIGFEDIFNTGEFQDKLIQPHAFVERKMNF